VQASAFAAPRFAVNWNFREEGWLKARAGELCARPDRAALMGISSGGHQAMLLTMRPHDPRYSALPLAGHAALDATVR